MTMNICQPREHASTTSSKHLLSQADPQQNFTIANSAARKVVPGSEVYGFKSFVEVIQLEIVASTSSMLEELQIRFSMRDFEQRLLADSIQLRVNGRIRFLPCLRILVIWVHPGGHDNYVEDAEIHELERVVPLLKHMGVYSEVVTDTRYQSVDGTSTKHTTAGSLRIG